MEALPHWDLRRDRESKQIKLINLGIERRSTRVCSFALPLARWLPSPIHLDESVTPGKYQKKSSGEKAPPLVIRLQHKGPSPSSRANDSSLASSGHFFSCLLRRKFGGPKVHTWYLMYLELILGRRLPVKSSLANRGHTSNIALFSSSICSGRTPAPQLSV